MPLTITPLLIPTRDLSWSSGPTVCWRNARPVGALQNDDDHDAVAAFHTRVMSGYPAVNQRNVRVHIATDADQVSFENHGFAGLQSARHGNDRLHAFLGVADGLDIELSGVGAVRWVFGDGLQVMFTFPAEQECLPSLRINFVSPGVGDSAYCAPVRYSGLRMLELQEIPVSDGRACEVYESRPGRGSSKLL